MSDSSRLSDAQHDEEHLVLLPSARQKWALGKCVRHVLRPGTFDQRHDPVLDKVPDVVQLRVNVARKLSVDLIVGDLDACRVVLPDLGRVGLFVSKPEKDRQQVDHFLASHGRRDVLRLGRAQSHTILSLGLPRDRRIVEAQH
eukprot:241270-Rhodomonas_salina.1